MYSYTPVTLWMASNFSISSQVYFHSGGALLLIDSAHTKAVLTAACGISGIAVATTAPDTENDPVPCYRNRHGIISDVIQLQHHLNALAPRSNG